MQVCCLAIIPKFPITIESYYATTVCSQSTTPRQNPARYSQWLSRHSQLKSICLPEGSIVWQLFYWLRWVNSDGQTIYNGMVHSTQRRTVQNSAFDQACAQIPTVSSTIQTVLLRQLLIIRRKSFTSDEKNPTGSTPISFTFPLASIPNPWHNTVLV